ncbi:MULTISPECIES: DUF4199 domain-containing protein [Flavobacteriaceae]|uniref:DUF4199 domain-containing protein n=1 Tax=Flavobacteriaceae TaxID=49546 RepID=UPI00149153A8|nr:MULTISPECIES: DUF4199 domain-containing protein [Allomuricauda]MDC6366843.1 DUF4199 domain-containing protein [Muricauda sp. AC10]
MDYKAATIFGALLGVVSIAYFLCTNLLGISGNELVGWLGYVPYILMIYWGLVESKALYENYGSRFLFGVLVSFIGSIVGSLFMYLYLIYVDDLMIRNAIENQIVSLDSNSADYEMLVAKIKTVVTPTFYLIFGIVSGLLIGTLISAIMPLVIISRK